MLIGNDVFPSVICSMGGIIHIQGFLIALETLLGWIFVGMVSELENCPLPLTSMFVSLKPSIDVFLG